jgi:hypothetical protein
MEPDGSLPSSQDPSTGPYPEPDHFNPIHTILSKIHFNSSLTYALVFPVVSFLLATHPF